MFAAVGDIDGEAVPETCAGGDDAGAAGVAEGGEYGAADGATCAVCTGAVGTGADCTGAVCTGVAVCTGAGAAGEETAGAWYTGGWLGTARGVGAWRGTTGMVGPEPHSAGGVPAGQGFAVAVAASSVQGLIAVAAAIASNGFLTVPPYAWRRQSAANVNLEELGSPPTAKYGTEDSQTTSGEAASYGALGWVSAVGSPESTAGSVAANVVIARVAPRPMGAHSRPVASAAKPFQQIRPWRHAYGAAKQERGRRYRT